MSENMIRDIMTQLLSAVKYMHNFKVLHRDIKLENIVLVKKMSSKDEKMQIKLIDFGISCNLNKSNLNL
jgi:serine/threonine protein kinase